MRAAAGQEAQACDEDGDADGDVDEEDPVPVQGVDDEAAQQHADGAAARRDEAEVGHRLGARARLLEEVHDEGEGDGGLDGGADALHGARCHQGGGAGRKPARQRGEREEHDAAEEEAARPVQVAHPSTQQKEAPEGEHERVDDPGEARRRETQVGLDGGQRDIDDGGVEHFHQCAEAEHDEGEPASAVIAWIGHASSSCVKTRPWR